jgi:acyl phosphate:glycerol-3-phosphate acyltransferase
MIYFLGGLIAAYLLGSIPTAYIFGKLLKNIDIREYGSGNVGATNVFRSVGKIPGIIVLLLDLLKGLAAVTLIPMFLEKLSTTTVESSSFCIALGAAVIAGHVWTVFLRFKGGKGVATTAGVMAGLSPWLLLASFIVWVVVFGVWKYVSLASISASTSLPIFAVIGGESFYFILFCAVLCTVGVFGHRSNIRRLIRGEEKKIL